MLFEGASERRLLAFMYHYHNQEFNGRIIVALAFLNLCLQTYIGRVIIAINPFKALQIYGPDAVDFYRGVDNNADSKDDFDVPSHDDRATRCTTAKMPADILENRRRSLQACDSRMPSGPSIFKNMKVHASNPYNYG